MSFKSYIVLTRPANIFTAHADIIAGLAIAGAYSSKQVDIFRLTLPQFVTVICLLLSTTFLYSGGIALNDFFDVIIDAKERPERPLPSGKVSTRNALIFILTLFVIGIVAAFNVAVESGIIAVVIALLCLSYNAAAKHRIVLGPVNMGLCRGMNLALGVSAAGVMMPAFWLIVFIPIAYIAGVTLMSKNEVYGGGGIFIKTAIMLYIVAIAFVISLVVFKEFNILKTAPFLIFFIFSSFIPALIALRNTTGTMIQNAVKFGVLSLIILDAALAAGFGGLIIGVVALALLPVSIFTAKRFSVT